MDRFLDLLNTVKKKSNSRFHSCEPELIELMRQIDEMIELKKEEWKGDIESLETKLHEAHNENRILTKEIQLLKTDLKDEKKSHACTLTQYEKDVKLLKDDMARLKKKYVELQKKIEYTKKKNAKVISQNEKLENVKNGEGGNPLNCEIYQNEILILRLKLESLSLENNNLRVLMQEQSKQITERNHYSELSVPEVAMYRESVEQVSRESAFEAPTHDIVSSYVFEANSSESSEGGVDVLSNEIESIVFQPNSAACSKANNINNARSRNKGSYVFQPNSVANSMESNLNNAQSREKKSYVFEPNSVESSKENIINNARSHVKKSYVFEPNSVASSKENNINKARPYDKKSYVFEPNSAASSKANNINDIRSREEKSYVFEPNSVPNSKENNINNIRSRDKKSYVFEPAVPTMPKISEEDLIETSESYMFEPTTVESSEIVLVTKEVSSHAQPGPSGMKKDRIDRDRRSTILESPQLLNIQTLDDEQTRQRNNSMTKYKFGGHSHETGLEYLDPDNTLEDKLHKIFSQFESVTSSMLL